MRVLVLSDEVWNDQIHSNNVLSNWFDGTDIEFANIYASPGMPMNKCCRYYFQVTDSMMFKSIISMKKAGDIIDVIPERNDTINDTNSDLIYRVLKPIIGSFLRFIRECIWSIGRYDTNKLNEFIDNFKPDIVFSERYATRKMLRLERIVMSHTSCPIVAFTGDDEYSLQQISFSPSYWINRFLVRKQLRKNAQMYSLYYTLSEDQRTYYESKFGIKCDILRKCGEFENSYKDKTVNEPISLVYAGKLYCNRWKALADIVKVIKEINANQTKIVLHIYTKDELSKKQYELLNDEKNSMVHPAVTPNELNQVYKKADIALHVESCDLKNRLLTRYSFSTKIIDCMFSSCAVMAYCWENQTGYKYLKNSNAAICVSNIDELRNQMEFLTKNRNLITDYQKRMYEFANTHHIRKKIQKKIKTDFLRILRRE